ncbi:MAG TPA: 16S rRNA (cytidine(1402)-2'-O)-methyltransferase [Steroidobacteraceae bacterium]|nr:16S rRNA (cytidine(1402)-2'-O)-methyltransferase [Steroidobacteraceae bacterium]
MARPRPPRREIAAEKSDSSPGLARGVLYIVATPIGNLGDLSARARAVLNSCDLVAAEDTRHASQLLKTVGLTKRLVSAHEHNEAQRATEILAALDAGQSVALVSDAGTPLISDPGYRIVRSVASAGYEVRAVPGPCAAIAALSIAGIPSDRFIFEGFLAPKSAARRARLAELAAEARTLIVYEAPHRLEETLLDMSETLGPEREAAVAREITKAFETVYRGTLAELGRRVQGDPDMKRGEIVIVVAGVAERAPQEERELERVLAELLKALPVSQAADIAARITGANRNRAYKLALQSAKS